MKIFFMGTPEFARIALESLNGCGRHEIIGTAAQPDKPYGRKRELKPPAVKEYAVSQGIDVYQPKTLRSGKFYRILKNLAPDVIVVAAYGKILPENILGLPKYGCINIHASLLPKYRGASPINAAIRMGETVTGITIIQMDSGIDTGDMLARSEIPIGENETCGELTPRLAEIGGRLALEVIDGMESGRFTAEPQNHSQASHTEKIDTPDCRIDWNRPAAEIHNMVRSLSPDPCAFTGLSGKSVKIIRTLTVRGAEGGAYEELEAGTVIILGKCMYVKAGGGILRITELQPSGKKPMPAASFINGLKNAGAGIVKFDRP